MSSNESIYDGEVDNRKKKRRKGNNGLRTSSKEEFSLKPLFDLLDDVETPFEDSMGKLLPEYFHDRAVQQEKNSEKDSTGQLLRPLTRSDITSFLNATTTSSLGPFRRPWLYVNSESARSDGVRGGRNL
ncbi:hypothetical protein K438DRAFT_252421 [Mycena galopus ATCC 62051]|nr:hypothetical protein K438DRAFT_252421 [Mycena galopus ATCC 62051]